MAVHYRTCPFCEATCGLEVETQGTEVVSVRGDKDDVLSGGFICPKAHGLKQLHEDPDRLTTPLIRRGGELVEASWDEAFEEIDRRLSPILAEHGRNSVAVYIGNPNAHNLSALVYGPVWLRALGTQNIYSASTVDQMPKQVSAGLMFGTMLSVPVPDVDRTDHLLILGANPLVSNGSLLTAPDMRGRLRRIRERGGKVVVVDPRRTRTAEAADEHHFIRPGTDALLLAAMACTLVEEGLAQPGAVAAHLNGLDQVAGLVSDFAPERVAAACGIAAEEIRRLARELAAAPSAAVYARIGTCTQEFGTLASWLVDVLNALTGNLDREGGAMFPLAAAGQKNAAGAGGAGRGVRLGRWHTRVRGQAESYGELPVACLAEEIDTPGEGQVRALVTVAGNPVVSTPNAERLESAIEGLDFMLAVDIYVNETTRHADVILPAPEPLEKSHYDLALYQLAVHNVANYSPAVFEASGPAEWEIFLRLAGVLAGQGPQADVEALDDLVIATVVGREVATEGSPVEGRDPAELIAELEPRRGPERVLDFMLRVGPYRLSLDALESRPHGIDLGPHRPRLPGLLRTAVGQGGAGARRDRGRPGAAARRAGARAKRGHGADRPPPAALEQLVDAQLAGAGEGQGALHAAHPPRRCGPSATRKRRPGSGELGGGLDRGGGRADRRDHARRGVDPPRLGPRRPRAANGGRPRARRSELQRALGRVARRRAVGQRRAQRDSGRAGAGGPAG